MNLKKLSVRHEYTCCFFFGVNDLSGTANTYAGIFVFLWLEMRKVKSLSVTTLWSGGRRVKCHLGEGLKTNNNTWLMFKLQLSIFTVRWRFVVLGWMSETCANKNEKTGGWWKLRWLTPDESPPSISQSPQLSYGNQRSCSRLDWYQYWKLKWWTRLKECTACSTCRARW